MTYMYNPMAYCNAEIAQLAGIQQNISRSKHSDIAIFYLFIYILSVLNFFPKHFT